VCAIFRRLITETSLELQTSPLYPGFSVVSSHDKNKAFILGEQIGSGEKKRTDGDAKQQG
jgi:hypothetical protein